jgi:uncharacterized protein (TIGR02611 family)
VATSKEVIRWIGRNSKRAAITVVGFVLVLGGIVLLPLPGPGWLVIFAGLAVLGTEYAWAQRTLEQAKKRARSAAAKARAGIRRRRVASQARRDGVGPEAVGPSGPENQGPAGPTTSGPDGR